MLCVIWHHLYSIKNVKNTHGGVLLLAKLQASTRNFTKNNTSPWVFFTFFKLYKWYQIAQRTTYAGKYWSQKSSYKREFFVSEYNKLFE